MSRTANISVKNTGSVATTFYYALGFYKNVGGSDCGVYAGSNAGDLVWEQTPAAWYYSMSPVQPGATETITISGLPDVSVSGVFGLLKVRTSASSASNTNCLDGAISNQVPTSLPLAQIMSFTIT